MSRYADGFVTPFTRAKIADYLRFAKKTRRIWFDHGALDYKECVLEDPTAPKMVPFPKMIKAKEGETVALTWIIYKSRAHRDRVNAAVMRDPRMVEIMGSDDTPFDNRRMAYGGFSVIVDGRAEPGS